MTRRRPVLPRLWRRFLNSAFGGEINREAPKPVAAFVMLARYGCESGTTMSLGRGLQSGSTAIV